jgi:N4-gp56 family major capsid protein
MPATLLGTPFQAKPIYDRNLIDAIRATGNLYNAISTDTLAKRTGNSVEFRSFPAWAVPSTPTPITDGQTPSETVFTVTNVTTTLQQYGAYAIITDQLDLVGFDPVLNETSNNAGFHAKEIMEQLIANFGQTSLNVMFANKRVSRATVQATDVITTEDVDRMVVTLMKNKAPKNHMKTDQSPDGQIVDTGYYLFVHPNVAYNLKRDPDWKAFLINKPGASGLDQFMIAEYSGVKVLWSDFCPVFAGAGASGANVYQSWMFSKAAMSGIGVGQYGGGRAYFETVTTELGSAGSADPLKQRMTTGWKGWQAFCFKQPGWWLKYESASTF